MSRKLTSEFVKSQFELAGYEMLSEYVSARSSIKFRCPHGHVHEVSFDSFSRGTRCRTCAVANRANLQRLDHNFVKSQFALAGYEMLGEYVNSKTPIKFRCNNGHVHQIPWNSFNQGDRCGFCSGRYNANDDIVKTHFELAGYKMLSNYVNNSTPIECVCDRGHAYRVTWANFRLGKRCGICAGNQKLDHEFVKSQFELADYEMLSEYVNGCKKIQFRCDRGHIGQIAWNHFRNGKRCKFCADINRSSAQRLDLEFVRSQFELINYEVLSDYVNAQTPIKFRCNKGHIHEVPWSNFSRGTRCGICQAEDFYKNRDNRAVSRIVGTISREIKRQSFTIDWSYFYAEDQIKAIAEPIKSIYDTCPKGHAVDHIVPVSFYNLLNEDELIACWSPANLRHLDAIANIKRHNKMTPEEIAFMEQNHPEIINAASRRPLLAVKVP